MHKVPMTVGRGCLIVAVNTVTLVRGVDLVQVVWVHELNHCALIFQREPIWV